MSAQKLRTFLQFTILIPLFFSVGEVFAQSSDWRITKTSWSQQDEIKWQEFVQAIGEQVEKRKCFKVGQCLKLPANPFVSSDPANFLMKSDCADFPYNMRAYFAWKNKLPFSVITEVQPRKISGNERGDIRYNAFGNQPVRRTSFINSKGVVNALEALNTTIPGLISSATFRMNEVPESANTFTDFYPIKIQRSSLKPGTVIYDPNGHVALVYKVTNDGKIYYIDAHPDNSLTSGLFNPKFARSHPGQGAGFKNFRPLRLVGATQNSQGFYVGGQIQGTPNAQISDYSLEQFYGNSYRPGQKWNEGSFVINGQKLTYYEYVRQQMALGTLKINPIDDLRSMVADICVSLKDRVIAVDTSLKTGIQNKSHPAKLPYNIYGTTGDWENYSTPSRDARLKVSYVDLREQILTMLDKFNRRDSSIEYQGTNLKADLLQTYEAEARACVIEYQNSLGRKVALNLEQIRQRLFALSFDPYHCAELRWGATSNQELASCQDSQEKMEWYRREQWLRNQIERRYDARMDYGLYDLTGPKPGAGVLNPPETDIRSILR